MSIFGDNVARLRAARGLSQQDLADQLHISRGAVGVWETKDTLPDYDRIRQIAKLFEISEAQLFMPYAPSQKDTEFDSIELRVYGKVSARTVEKDAGNYGFPCPTYLTKRHPKAFYLEVCGESMNRVLPNGALTLVDPVLRDRVATGRVYAVCAGDHDAVIRRVRVLEHGFQLDPDSTDPTFHPEVYDFTVKKTAPITIIGAVVWYVIPFDFDI